MCTAPSAQLPPKSCRVSGSPQYDRNWARSGEGTIAVIAAGAAVPAVIKVQPGTDGFSFCLELPHPDPAGSAPILPLIPITLWQSRVDIKAVEFADPFPAPLS